MSNIEKRKKNEVAVIDFKKDAGAGVGTISRTETIIPYVNLLQALSPECTEGHEKFVEGARAGMLLNTATKDLFSGKDGIVIVPLLKQHVFVEWTPRNKGGGIVARHEPASDLVLATCKADRRDDKGFLLTETGNHLVETFYLTALLLSGPDAEDGDVVCISFARTKLGPWRKLMQPVYKYSKDFPLFAHRIRLRTKPATNKQGQGYFTFEPDFLNHVEGGLMRDHVEASLITSPALYELAKSSSEFVSQGLKDGTVRHDEDAVDDGAAEGTPDTGKAPF